MLVKGYLLNREIETLTEQTVGQEILYAVCEDGFTITCTREYSTSFFKDGDTWLPTKGLPENVQFIGNYKAPTSILL